MGRYRGRHLRRRPKGRGPVVVGTAAVMWLSAEGARAATVVVRRGDTLSAIAERHGTSVGAIATANGIKDPNLVVAGQRLRVPGDSSSTYVVRRGDTLSEIALRSGTSVRALARANRLSDPNLIRVGQRLRVPSGAPTASRTVSPPAAAPSGDVEDLLVSHALSHAVDPALVKAVAWQESGWQQSAVSSKGAVGVMQVIPSTARFVNGSLGGGNLRLRRVSDNIHLGVMYLRHMLDVTGSERRALAAYYSGPGNVRGRLEPYQRRYVRSVEALKRRFR